MSDLIFTSLGDQIQEVIIHHPHLRQRKVHFLTGQAGEVTLQGEVDSFFEKQLAQEAVRSVHGVTGITNQLQVVRFPR